MEREESGEGVEGDGFNSVQDWAGGGASGKGGGGTFGGGEEGGGGGGEGGGGGGRSTAEAFTTTYRNIWSEGETGAVRERRRNEIFVGASMAMDRETKEETTNTTKLSAYLQILYFTFSFCIII